MNKEEIINWLTEEDPAKLTLLQQQADKIRKEIVGDVVHIRGIIEFSNYCMRNCLYCGLRRENKKLKRYRLEPQEIYEIAKFGIEHGCKTIVLQSGEDNYYTIEQLCKLIEKIKNNYDVAITLSIGEKTYEEYKALKEAGADRYLLKFETSDTSLFKKLKPDGSYKNRFKCLEYLKKLEYQVGSGNIIGLPEQSIDSLANDILLFKELELDMIGIGPFIPHPDTPLKNSSQGEVLQVLKIIAITRIIMGYPHIPATTAIGTIDPQGRQKALMWGANVIMPNITPKDYRAYYQIYPGKSCVNEELTTGNRCIQKIILSLGRKVGIDRGDSLRFKKRA